MILFHVIFVAAATGVEIIVVIVVVAVVVIVVNNFTLKHSHLFKQAVNGIQ